MKTALLIQKKDHCDTPNKASTIFYELQELNWGKTYSHVNVLSISSLLRNIFDKKTYRDDKQKAAPNDLFNTKVMFNY